jgi:eukaryotic-like serine/threonine-protein kinase
VSFAAGQFIAGRYVLRRLLGAGGMGAVWVADDTRLKTEVALKFVLPQVNGSEIVERFRREAQIVAQIRSPNVVQIIDVGIDEAGRDFLAMELLVGEDFGSLLLRRDRLTIDEALTIVTQAARGLARAHSQGVVHRDVKPENLFLCTDEMGMTVKVLDFGIAKGGPSGAQSNLTSMGSIIGTPDYMSSEQVMNEGPCTPATDLYALAAVFYRALTGTVPFVGKSVTEQLVRITADPLRPASSLEPSIPPSLDAWFETALAKDPATRPASARVFVDTLLTACGRGAGGTERLSGASWVEATGANAAIPSSLTPAILGAPSVRNPTTTKSITLEGRAHEPLTIPVASRAPLFVLAALAGLVVAGGLVFVLSTRFGKAHGDNSSETALAATSPVVASAATPTAGDGPTPTAATTAPTATAAATTSATTTITPATATTPTPTPTPAKTAKTTKPIQAKPPGPTTKKTNETDYY